MLNWNLIRLKWVLLRRCSYSGSQLSWRECWLSSYLRQRMSSSRTQSRCVRVYGIIEFKFYSIYFSGGRRVLQKFWIKLWLQRQEILSKTWIINVQFCWQTAQTVCRSDVFSTMITQHCLCGRACIIMLCILTHCNSLSLLKSWCRQQTPRFLIRENPHLNQFNQSLSRSTLVGTELILMR